MIKLRQFSPLFLALLLQASPLLAQSEDADLPSKEDASAADQDTTQKSTATKTAQDSPFEYRPSEEISEDVPVSFPVDI